MDISQVQASSVGSGSTLRDTYNLLLAQRQLLEIEADAIFSELNSPGPNGEPPAGVNDPLIDREGFPRGDIDLYNVRNKRARLRCINNDHKGLMRQIENLLPLLYAELTSKLPSSVDTARISQLNVPSKIDSNEPLATIDEILDGSPAHQAGLQNGDILMQFGSIANTNRTEGASSLLSKIPSIVNHAHQSGTHIPVVVKRYTSGDTTLIEVILRPMPWGGRGLLGCHLTPVK